MCLCPSYQVWEPSDMQTIDSCLTSYVKSGSSHALKFAINIDPVQFQLYAAPQTGTSWNQIVDAQVRVCDSAQRH